MTNENVTYENMTAVLNQHLQDYAKEVQKEYGECGREITEMAVERLKATSPKGNRKSKKYADTWTYKTESGILGSPIYIIYNDKNYGLTHLLEYGHVVANGTGRIAGKEAGARPHIAKVEKWVKEEFPKMMERKLGGK